MTEDRPIYKRIIGNDRIKSAFRSFAEKKTFPSSMIISGKKGSGKFTFAIAAAMSVACEKNGAPCMECEACRKISSGISPDVYVISVPKDKKTIGVEAVRLIKESAYYAPNDLNAKFYIIKDADTMTDQAQNALLKLFEEPPAGVYFILLCQRATSLLATVRSRAPEFRTELIPREEISKLLRKDSPDAEALYKNDRERFERIIMLSRGSVGEAKRLIDGADKGALALYSAAQSVIDSLCSGNKAELLSTFLGFSDREGLTELLRLLIDAFRDMTLAKKAKGEGETVFFSDLELARQSASGFSLKGLLDTEMLLREKYGEVSKININVRTAAVVIADGLWNRK